MKVARAQGAALESELLDTLLEGFKIKNDAQLAAWLGVDKSLIYAIRAGKRRLGLMQRLKILDHIGYLKACSILNEILPQNLARALSALNQRLVQNQIAAVEDQAEVQTTNIEVLDAAKLAFGYETDATLAEFLKVEHNTLATIRAGKSALGPKPRLRILGRLTDAFNADRLISQIASSKSLISLINQWAKQQRASQLSFA